jgi:biotin carboxyl carrier protein
MQQSFTLNLDGADYSVEIHGNTVIVNGHPFVVGFDEDERVTVDGISYDVAIDGENAIVDGIARRFRASGLDVEPSIPSTARPTPVSAGVGAVRAIMPGTIVRVQVEEGDEVSAGDVLLVLEAMKMENELQAPISGVVSRIYARRGQAVEMNAVLAEVEPSS